MRGRLKLTKKDKEWAAGVKDRDGWECVICGSKVKPSAHHLIPREEKTTKYEINNGLTLCPNHHLFSRKISAHNNPLALARWLMLHRPNTWIWIIKKLEELENEKV